MNYLALKFKIIVLNLTNLLQVLNVNLRKLFVTNDAIFKLFNYIIVNRISLNKSAYSFVENSTK